MTTATVVCSIIALLFFFILGSTYQIFIKQKESGLLHLLLAFMFLFWLPLPYTVQKTLEEEGGLAVGTLFGTVSFFIFVITMVFQAGHLSYAVKHAQDHAQRWEERNDWMLNGLLGGTAELFAGFLKGIWTIFLTVAFFVNHQLVMGTLGIVYGLVGIIYLLLLVNQTSVREMPLLDKLYRKLSFIFFNVETASWNTALSIWLVLR